MRFLKNLFISTIVGFFCGSIVLMLVFHWGFETDVALTLLPANEGDQSLGFWALSFYCGIFSLFVVLMCLKSKRTIILPIIITGIFYFYFFAKTVFVHAVMIALAWIVTIAIIPLGLIPALLTRYFFANSTAVAIGLSVICGYITGVIIRYFEYGTMPWSWNANWFSKTSYKPLLKRGGSETYDGEHYAGTSYTDPYGTTHSYDSDGHYAGTSYTDPYGTTHSYDSDGHYAGTSYTDPYGTTHSYDSDGHYAGTSYTDNYGTTHSFDEDGHYTGTSQNY